MNEKHGFSMIIMRLVVLLVALAVKCFDGVLDEKIGRNLVDLSWEHESGCMVLVPQISASQEEFYSLSDPKEGTVCTSPMGLKMFYTDNDFEGNTGECVSASVCSYELRCEYRDYTELCGIETVAELQNYRQNCVALGVLANGVDDKVFEPGMVCRPEDIDQNTPKMTPSPTLDPTSVPWEHESGCTVLVPKISASQEEFYSLSDPKEGTLCTSLMRLKVFYTNNDFEGNTGECVSASVCSYELRCEYRDYTELCGIETVAELQNYRQNCVALGVLANVVDDKVFEPGMVCRPEDIDQNTPKMTPSPISGTTMRPSTPPPTSVQEPADTSGSTQTFNRLLQYAALLLAAFYGM
ncbi:unnamed protein product [Cylindrotheca closterium]|uniref:Subtilisin n=1 Tax=Cylindrotheca closterium TaxID=2856 RepID=A0AAD2JNN8_9STRA|nr:unnamed protein product [Cylindrotheca closterium]